MKIARASQRRAVCPAIVTMMTAAQETGGNGSNRIKCASLGPFSHALLLLPCRWITQSIYVGLPWFCSAWTPQVSVDLRISPLPIVRRTHSHRPMLWQQTERRVVGPGGQTVTFSSVIG